MVGDERSIRKTHASGLWLPTLLQFVIALEARMAVKCPRDGKGGLVLRERFLRRGVWLEAATVGWNVVEGLIAVSAGIFASSVALIGFGVDSFVETTSGAVVGWRLRAELVGRLDNERGEALERRAGRIAGALLFGLAAYIVADAGRRLFGFGAEAKESRLGIVLTAISLVVMPLLAWAKLRTATALRSGALRADAYETITCSWLSLTTLAGLILNAALGWWWADPLAALAIVPLAVREGLEGWRGECPSQTETRPLLKEARISLPRSRVK
jgi:divalent metal cation (Fe/Co/Zn/Cd) transporter